MNSKLEVRSVNDFSLDGGKLVGYAARFNVPSDDLGGFIETIKPGAFTRTLVERPDVFVLFEHDHTQVIGRTLNGSLTLAEDEMGLRFSVTPNDTSWARDAMELVRRGDLAGMSFGFRVPQGGYTIDTSQSPALRTLHDIDLYEVSLTSLPAFPQTDVSIRSIVSTNNNIARARLSLAQIL